MVLLLLSKHCPEPTQNPLRNKCDGRETAQDPRAGGWGLGREGGKHPQEFLPQTGGGGAKNP